MTHHTMTDSQVNEVFGEKSARWYQIAARNQVREALAAGHKRICVVSPTGTGKTMTGGLILVDDGIRELLNVDDGQPMRVLFACHRHRLLTQAEQTYADQEGIEVITQSIASPIPEGIKFDLVLVDECHHEATMGFQRRLEQLTQAPIIGLTATVDRADFRLLKFSIFIEPLTREEAVQQGYLAESDIHSFIDSPTRDPIDLAEEIIANHHSTMGQIMVFVRTRAQAHLLTQKIQNLGLTARALVDMSEARLNDSLSEFEKKEIQYVVSCMKIGEGVDVKGCDGVMIVRSLRSMGLLNQMIGRAARIGSDCRIYELINPLSNQNLSATAVVGQPRSHHAYYKVRGEWRTQVLS